MKVHIRKYKESGSEGWVEYDIDVDGTHVEHFEHRKDSEKKEEFMAKMLEGLNKLDDVEVELEEEKEAEDGSTD